MWIKHVRVMVGAEWTNRGGGRVDRGHSKASESLRIAHNLLTFVQQGIESALHHNLVSLKTRMILAAVISTIKEGEICR